MTAPASKPVWREPMVWLVVGLPALVLVAAAITIALGRQASADASGSDTRRIAQVQLEDLAPDREAARRGLQAELGADPSSGRIDVTLDGPDGAEESLELRMLHPISERLDRHVVLRRDADAWRGDVAPWTGQAWELRLQPTHRGWRLTGRISSGATHAALRPAVAR